MSDIASKQFGRVYTVYINIYINMFVCVQVYVYINIYTAKTAKIVQITGIAKFE